VFFVNRAYRHAAPDHPKVVGVALAADYGGALGDGFRNRASRPRSRLSGKQESGMTYTIGFGMRNKREVSTAEKPTAKEALALVDALQRSDEEIKFISSPHEGEIDVEMLRVLAKEEGRATDRLK
jgi:hypothetical protein